MCLQSGQAVASLYSVVSDFIAQQLSNICYTVYLFALLCQSGPGHLVEQVTDGEREATAEAPK